MNTDTTSEQAANPVLLAFKKITTQLEQLAERERRAEERERKAQEREQKLIERQEIVYRAEIALAKEVLGFKDSVTNIEIRMKNYLSDYFKNLPETTVVVQEERWSIENNTKTTLYIILLGMLVSGLLVYFASPHVDTVRLDYQARKIEELEAKWDYMVEKNPKTAKSYEAENGK